MDYIPSKVKRIATKTKSLGKPPAYSKEEEFAISIIKMNYERGVAMTVESAKMEIRHHFVGSLLSERFKRLLESNNKKRYMR